MPTSREVPRLCKTRLENCSSYSVLGAVMWRKCLIAVTVLLVIIVSFFLFTPFGPYTVYETRFSPDTFSFRSTQHIELWGIQITPRRNWEWGTPLINHLRSKGYLTIMILMRILGGISFMARNRVLKGGWGMRRLHIAHSGRNSGSNGPINTPITLDSCGRRLLPIRGLNITTSFTGSSRNCPASTEAWTN